MRVLQINAVYGTGSTGHIVEDIHEYLENANIESYVFYGTARRGISDDHINRIGNTLDHKVHALFRRFSHKHGGHSVLATKILCKKIETISPDVVHLHNLHSNYLNLKVLFDYLVAKKIPVVLTLHDCWFFTGYCMYYLYYGGCTFWQNGCKNCPALKDRKSEIFLKEKETLFNGLKTYAAVGVSEWLAKDIERSVLHSADIIEHIYNWVDTEIFRPREIKTDYRKLFGIDEGKKIILGVAQGWSEVKGLNEFIYLAEKLKGVADIILVGSHKEGAYPDNLHFIDYIGDREELARLYGFVDLVVNPSKAEAFGLVTVEAMACGTPVVGYANTGTKELIKENCGKTVTDGDREELLVAVKQMLGEPKSKYSTECRNYIVKEFGKNTQIEKYVKIYKKLIDLDYAKK